MPSVSAPNLVLLRGNGHKTLLHLAVYQPATIWSTRVNGAQAQGDTTITVNAPTVVRAPAKNYQVMFGSVAGANDLGEARWKSYSAPTLTVGAHNTPLANGTYITVKEEIKPVAIHATLNATDVVFEDGNTAYTAGATGENLQYHPLALMGPPACAFIDPATGLATVEFHSSSTAIATGATIPGGGYAWVFPSGTPATSAVATPGNVTWNAAGQYYVSLTVTDSNNKTHTTYRPVFIYDSTTRPYSQVEIESLEGDVASGVWRASLKVWGTGTEAEFPDNAMVVLFAEDWYGNTKTSIGGQYTYRENIIWTGYVRGGSVKKNAEYGYIEFDAESISGVMTNLEGLAATLTSTAGTPAGWHELRDMTYNRAAFHILTEHSTISQIADCNLSLLSFTRAALDLPESSVFDQLQFNVATPTRGQCGCSAQGMFYLEENPQLIPLASRTHPNVFANSPAPNLASMALSDFRDELDFGRDMQDKVTAQVDFAAEDVNAAAIYSLAPATPWASGRGERISGIRADSQGDSNIFSGLFEGYRNNPYADVVLPLRGNYRVCDTFPPEQVQITLTAAQNKRGFAWANQRCWIKSVSYEYRTGGILLPTIVVEKDAYGYPGITGNYPTTPPDWPPPTFPPVEPPVEPPVIDPTDMPGKGNLLYVATYKGLAKCEGAYGTNGTDGAPVWTKMNGSGGGALGNVVIHWFNLDPFSVSGDHFAAGWAMTDGGLYRVTGLPTTPVWTSQLTITQAEVILGMGAGTGMFGRAFTPNVRKAGFIACTVVGPWRPGGGFHVDYYPVFVVWSLDYGATWQGNGAYYTEVALGAGQQASLSQQVIIFASQHVDDTYYLTTTHGAFSGNQSVSDNPTEAGLMRSIALPNFIKVSTLNVLDTSHGESRRYFPYCNGSGTAYGNDSISYVITEESATQHIQRQPSTFTPLWSAGYTPPRSVWVGHATMPADVDAWIFSNMFNENYGVAIDNANLWFTPNLSNATPTWTRYNVPTIGGRAATPHYHFCVPADVNIVFFSGSANGAGYALPFFTYDFGANFVDISQYGTGGALDTVMSLTADSDLNESTIIVDYFKP